MLKFDSFPVLGLHNSNWPNSDKNLLLSKSCNYILKYKNIFTYIYTQEYKCTDQCATTEHWSAKPCYPLYLSKIFPFQCKERLLHNVHLFHNKCTTMYIYCCEEQYSSQHIIFNNVTIYSLFKWVFRDIQTLKMKKSK